MRLIAAALAFAMTWFVIPAQAQQTCFTQDKVLEDSKVILPNATHLVLGKDQTDRLLTGLKREYAAPAELEGDSAIIFADPSKPNMLVVTFLGTCAKQQFGLSPAQFEKVMKDSSI